MLPANYKIRLAEPADYEDIIEICKLVYPTDNPYTVEELTDHGKVFPQGQFVAFDIESKEVAGVHFTLRLRMNDFHIDDPWDILTAGGSFLDHLPDGHTLYGADIMVHPSHQHHGLAHALTDQARFLVQELNLWRMVGGSRLPGYSKYAATMTVGNMSRRCWPARCSILCSAFISRMAGPPCDRFMVTCNTTPTAPVGPSSFSG